MTWTAEKISKVQALLDAGATDEDLAELVTKRQIQNAVHRKIISRPRRQKGRVKGKVYSPKPKAEQNDCLSAPESVSIAENNTIQAA